MRTPLAILLFAVAASAAAEQPATGPDPVLVGAGDIADCASLSGAAKTSALLDRVGGTVYTLGDNAYLSGTPQQFSDCYAPTWGRHKARTHPAVGNHEYRTAAARGYFDYFGEAAGKPDQGWYSYDLGRWHVVVVNSNCALVGGCGRTSAQGVWLQKDLADHPAPCTMAMWHHPRFSSGREHGDDPLMHDLWQILYDAGADAVISGHDHDYERFAPMDADGRVDAKRGIRQFVAGTGGKELYPFAAAHTGSEVKNNETFGVLKLTLHANGYDWEFLPVDGATFTDRGTETCHGRTSPAGAASSAGGNRP